MKKFIESGTILSEDTDKGTFKVRLISEGQGASAFYPGDVLERDMHVFDNAPSYFSHADGARNPVDLAGKIEGEVWSERDESGKVGVYGNYRPVKNSRIGDLFENFRDTLALSISAEGTSTVGEDGDTILESFDPQYPRTRVDVVDVAGARGAFMEQASEKGSENGSEGSAAPVNKGEIQMDEAGLKAVFDQALADFGKTLISDITKLLKPAGDASDGSANEAAVVEAAVEAGLHKASRMQVVEAMRADPKADFKVLIEAAKAAEDELKQSLLSEVAGYAPDDRKPVAKFEGYGA